MIRLVLLVALCFLVELSIGFSCSSRRHRQEDQRHLLAVALATTTSELDHTSSSSPVQNHKDLTNLLLRISYDGSRFTGWSAANQSDDDHDTKGKTNSKGKGFVRPVEQIIRTNIAKLYSNVNPKRIIIEGCSRTDKGVHARQMMAQVYCLTESAFQALQENPDASSVATSSNELYLSIPGKRTPHPISPFDASYFQPIPMGGNMSRMAFALNRMLPDDVRITGIAPCPIIPATTTTTDNNNAPFHATVSTISKTYEYRISIGELFDPTTRRFVWHLDGGVAKSKNFDLELVQSACAIVSGTHNFAAFEGAPKSPQERRERAEKWKDPTTTTCHLMDVSILLVEDSSRSSTFPASLQGVESATQEFHFRITGDRFLYKMNRFLVGALVAIGYGKLSIQDLERALETGSWVDPITGKRPQFQCAPAKGLTLAEVSYGDETIIDWQPLRY